MGTFSEYREYVAERERTLEAEYSNKIIALSEEVLGAKKDFEDRMKSFQKLQDQFNHEKEQALENLRREHQKEIESLERRVANSQLLNLEQKYIIEIRRLEDERKSLKVEKERLVETFDMKLRRAQSLYETQLSTGKKFLNTKKIFLAKALYSKELETLRSHEENLKEELTARHEEFRDRVQELKLQSRQSREEVSSCKTEITLLQKKLKQKESELEGITKEVRNYKNSF
jgi:chromosome segregation ATPase